MQSSSREANSQDLWGAAHSSCGRPLQPRRSSALLQCGPSDNPVGCLDRYSPVVKHQALPDIVISAIYRRIRSSRGCLLWLRGAPSVLQCGPSNNPVGCLDR